MRIRLLESEELDRARDFYVFMRYHGGVRDSNRVLAAEEGGEIIGAVRLCEEEGELVLRGMYIRKDHQRNGLGTEMLRRLESMIGNRKCWSVPFSHLVEFYGQAGFKTTEPEEAPEFLQNRLAGYQNKGMNVLLMVRT